MNRRTLFTSTAAVLALALGHTVSATRPAPPGPGAVLSMHKQLFAALDRGDVERLGELMAESPRGASWSSASGKESWDGPSGFVAYLPDSKGRPVSAENQEAGLKHLLAWSQEGAKHKGGGWKTEITRAWTDCHSEEISFAVLELERSRPAQDGVQIERFRSTSLVSFQKGRWVLWHVHISPQT